MAPNTKLAAEQNTFSRVVALVAKSWKSDGFIRKGQEFNRRTVDGIVQAVGFQKFRPSTPGEIAVRGKLTGVGGDVLAGRFVVNYRIVVPQIWLASHASEEFPD